ncbi:MAG: four-helix bundle copper-binding protein [Chitinivibrionales bacterium]|nr:four-helix bundle copper-binding protein [Chitinivibrionales bacterium]MBD3357021.1 four-helix bundle copper-binding protein [Chitinivibrionales bacterium]
MINSNPVAVSEPKKSELVSAINACIDCGQACTSCSDACLAEENVLTLRGVIRTTADSADMCTATAKILSRLNHPKWNVLRAVVDACITQVRVCGAECNEHSRMHEHCAVCAQSCRSAEKALQSYRTLIEER